MCNQWVQLCKLFQVTKLDTISRSELIMEFETESEILAIEKSWMLAASPTPMLVIFAIYLYLVLKVLPTYMMNRKPVNLTNFTRVYNVAQVIACSYFLTRSHMKGFSFKTTWQCFKEENDFDKIMEYKSVLWCFLILRLAELSETAIFVLRKKQSQVSVLHVYHHIATASLVWIFMKYNRSE